MNIPGEDTQCLHRSPGGYGGIKKSMGGAFGVSPSAPRDLSLFITSPTPLNSSSSAASVEEAFQQLRLKHLLSEERMGLFNLQKLRFGSEGSLGVFKSLLAGEVQKRESKSS